MKRQVLACLAGAVVGALLLLVSTPLGLAVMVFSLTAVPLVLWFGVLSAASQPPPERPRDFGGRYSDFGFLLGILGRPSRPTRRDHRPDESSDMPRDRGR
jgi:hypothetical protein